MSTWCAFPLNVKLHAWPLMVVVPVQPIITVPLTEQSTGVKMVVPLIVASIHAIPVCLHAHRIRLASQFRTVESWGGCAIGSDATLRQEGEERVCPCRLSRRGCLGQVSVEQHTLRCDGEQIGAI